MIPRIPGLPLILLVAHATTITAGTYPVVDTGQAACFNNWQTIAAPSEGQPFHGQDAQYSGNQPSYTDNGDGTVTDTVTGLMWQKAFTKSDYADAQANAASAATGGYDDWRIPTIKELYSLILFTGNQGSAPPASSEPPDDAVPFIDTTTFEFEYATTDRYIDAQYLTSTEYVYTTMNGNSTFFGVNFADGRIKGYPQSGGPVPVPGGRFYLRLVRGVSTYGQNAFESNGDGTITDHATGLMWLEHDSGDSEFADAMAAFTNDDGSLNWEEALVFAENLEYAGHDDWRLPDAKELHSIVDYTRSPDTSNSAAIDPLFDTTAITNEAGEPDYPFYWSSTTFEPGTDAIYISFGRALGYMDFGTGPDFYDVHGAGAQRTDPKTGTPSYGFGPQGDVRRVYNYVRPVRDADSEPVGIDETDSDGQTPFLLLGNHPNPFNPATMISYELSSPASVRLEVFGLDGQRIRTLVDGPKPAGSSLVVWDATDDRGNRVGSGGYLYCLRAGNRAATGKMLLIR